MATNKTTVGANMRKIRKDKGLTAEEMATGLGCTVMQVFNYENGRTRITETVIFKAAKVLGVAPCKLLAGAKK